MIRHIGNLNLINISFSSIVELWILPSKKERDPSKIVLFMMRICFVLTYSINLKMLVIHYYGTACMLNILYSTRDKTNTYMRQYYISQTRNHRLTSSLYVSYVYLWISKLINQVILSLGSKGWCNEPLWTKLCLLF